MPVKLQAEMYILNMLTTMSRAKLTEAQSGFATTNSDSLGNYQMEKLSTAQWTITSDQEVDRHQTGAIANQDTDGETNRDRSL
jgi:hypothetical protein